ncbi:DUF805 domain-containing protein [Vibrio maerlii]|uniref:DUF805 domain-containing protein n=1 Tax=Vibrio maerlii TaxID=2231648 RepID=UPI000E3B8D17|nr:DUF805 domain-containing protein [Vibrio maerlii]
MSVKALLFSSQGRINRKTFWMWNAVYYITILGSAVGVNTLFPAYSYLILPVILIALAIPDLVITLKRWHDRNKSAYWLALNIPLILGRVVLPSGGADAATQSMTTLQSAVSISALICGIWILIECGFMKGTTGTNKYGPQPD